MPFTCEYKELPAQPILAVRVRTRVEELPQTFGQWYGAIAGYLGELGETPAGAPFCGLLQYGYADLDMGIGFPVAGDLPGKGEIMPARSPAADTPPACSPGHTASWAWRMTRSTSG